MAHIDPRREHRRAKMLDLANNSVKGSDGRGGRRWSSRNGRQLKRRFERSTYHHLRDFRCSGDVECECPGCSCESWTANDTWARRWVDCKGGYAHYVKRGGPDNLSGAIGSAEKWAYRLGSIDELFSWLKRNYPDTLAGRHAIDHIMSVISWIVGCTCNINIEFGSKGNHGQCTCGAYLDPTEPSFVRGGSVSFVVADDAADSLLEFRDSPSVGLDPVGESSQF
jgi:hypothetical protein